MAAPAAAQTTSSETFKGVIVTSGVSGTRTVVSSVILAKGVFRGVGEIVEAPTLPATLPTSAATTWSSPRAACTWSARWWTSRSR
jgi:hypothetical protein